MAQPDFNSGRIYPLIVSVIFTVLAVGLLCKLGPAQGSMEDKAFGGNNLRNVIAFPLHFDRAVEGLALIDPSNQTICIYQYQPQEPAHKRFALVAARSYKYDCQLPQFNTDPPIDEIKSWLLRANQVREGSTQPGPGPKSDNIPPRTNPQIDTSGQPTAQPHEKK